MNIQPVIRKIVLRLALLAVLLAGVTAAFVSASSATSSAAQAGHTGQAVALRVALHPSAAKAFLQNSPLVRRAAAPDSPAGLYPLSRYAPQYQPRLRKPVAGTAVAIAESVQTFDVFAPPPAFLPSPQDGPLTPTNLHPIWTSDERFLIFSRLSGDGHFHLFSISAKGDSPTGTPTLHQITSGNSDEDFPALNPSTNDSLAFTSTAGSGSANTPNLYVLNNFAPTTDPNVPPVDPSTLPSLTIRPDLTNGTGFNGVSRPTWSPSGDRLAFAALSNSPADPHNNFFHIYFLYVQSEGGRSASGPSSDNPPGVLTDVAANDLNPAWSPDGNFIAFARSGIVYLQNVAGGGPTQVTLGLADNEPAWNPNPDGFGQLAFARKPAGAANHDIYYIVALLASGNGIPTINTETSGAGSANAAIKLNTDDNAGQTTQAGNAYDDRYPTWAPQITTFRIAYQSNRSITYNNPGTNAPLEVAVSLPRNSATVGPQYEGILESLTQNLNPPTLLPYSLPVSGSVTPGEVVHVTDTASGKIVRNGDARAGGRVTFTVRLSDRESGVGQVFLQIKDPDSKYQDINSHGALEHKVFALGPQAVMLTAPVSSGSADLDLYNPFGPGAQLFNTSTGSVLADTAGVVGGNDGGTRAISVGRSDYVTNPNPVVTGTPPNTTPLPGGDPSQFNERGAEYECQYVNAQFNASGTNPDPGGRLGDYGTPFYLAGIDDRPVHSAPTPRPEWLPLTKAVTQDANGGVLYTATWTTPTSPSDYYLDVIAYDNARVPPLSGPVSPNWRIYDNVWGFSTQPFNGSNDILLVSDNTLGQKFVDTAFNNGGNSNLPPTFYGAESYFSDIAVYLLPNTVYTYIQLTPGQTQPVPMLVPIAPEAGTLVPTDPTAPTSPAGVEPSGAALNGLGVGSYTDSIVNQQQSLVDNISVPRSQQYSIWRILSRGALDPNVLKSYQPTAKNQPAVNDPQTLFTAPTASVQDAHRCVIWVSPYTSELPLNVPGSLADTSTQALLRAFVQGGTYTPTQGASTTFTGGGRLFVSGSHIASALSLQGSDPSRNQPGSFLVDILNAKWNSIIPSAEVLAGYASPPNVGSNPPFAGRIAYDAGANTLLGNFFTNPNGTYQAPSQGPLILGHDFGFDAPDYRTEAGLTEASVFNTLGYQDSVLAQNGAEPDIQYNTAGIPNTPGLVYLTNVNGSRVVYSSFGLEQLGSEYYRWAGDYSAAHLNSYSPLNQRPNILHNIVCFLRSGSFTGTITAANSGGQVVSGATVYLIPAATIPGARQTFSATSQSDGTYRIDGVEPGLYSVAAYRTGYSRTISNFVFPIEGDTTDTVNLNVTQVPPGTITGSVVDGNGAPIIGASIVFNSVDGVVQYTVTSGQNGLFTINNVLAGTYTGTASATNFPTQTIVNIKVPSGGTTSPPVNFVLNNAPGSGTIQGEVTDFDTGLPLAGATVALTDSSGNPAKDALGNPIPPVTTTSAATNNYVFSSVPPGSYNVTVTAPSYGQGGPVPVTVVKGQTVIQNFALSRNPGTLGGLVTSALTGLPPTVPITVTVTNASGATVGQATTDATGVTTAPPAGPTGDAKPINYTFTLPPGTYNVTATDPSGVYIAGGPTTVVITGGAFTRQDFALKEFAGSLGGLVTDAASGTALTGATVTVTNSSGTTVNDYNGKPAVFTTVDPVTRAAGSTGDGQPINYFFALLPGTYNIVFTAPNHTAQIINSVAVTGNVFTRQDAALAPTGGTLGGLVTDATTGLPITGATVTVRDSSSTVVASITTGASTTPPAGPTGDGKPINYATQTTLLSSTYTVTVFAPGYQSVTLSGVNIGKGTFTRADAALLSGTLGGLVSSATTGQALPGATVRITNTATGAHEDLAVGATTTPPNGATGDGRPLNYFANLPAGSYTVLAFAPGYNASAPVTVTIADGAFTRQDIVLTQPNGTLGGLVADAFTGQTIVGATVTVTNSAGKPVVTLTTGATTTPPAGATGDGKPLNYTTPIVPGTYTLNVTAPGFISAGPFTVTVSTGAFTRQDVGLVNAVKGTLGGLVTDSFTHQPIAGATVTVKDAHGATVGTTPTSASPTSPAAPGGDGRPLNYSVLLTEGRYTVTVTAPNHAPLTSAAVTVSSAGFTRQDFALVSTVGTLGGLVTDSFAHQPLVGATVTVTDSLGATVNDVNGKPAVFTTVAPVTRSAGATGDGSPISYFFALTVGAYNVTVAAPNHTPLSQTNVVITANAFKRQDFALVSTIGTLGGLVVDSFTHQPGAGVTVTVTDASGATVTDANGRPAVFTTGAPTSPTAPTGDGKPINYTFSLHVGAYTVTAVAPNHTPLSQANVVVTPNAFKRQDFALVSTVGTLGGLVSDSFTNQPLGGVTVTVKNASGATVSTVSTSASLTSPAAPVGDGHPLNYSLPLTQGPYTVTITPAGGATPVTRTATVTPNAFTRLDFTGSNGVAPLHVFNAGYNFFSVPYDYAASGVTFDALLGTRYASRDNPGTGNRSAVAVWAPQLVQYVIEPTAPADGLHLGQGYWVYLLHAAAVRTNGVVPSTTTISVGLKPGWNMIGVPSITAVSLSRVTFANPTGGPSFTFDQASSNTYHLVLPTLYGYNGSTYNQITSGSALQPWQAYWIYAFANTTIQLPTGGG